MDLSPGEAQAAELLAEVFSLDRHTPHLISRSEGLVFDMMRGEDPFILKMNISTEEGLADLEAQLDWIRYLSENDVLVPDLIESIKGNLLEALELDTLLYTAFVYHKIPLSDENKIDWNDGRIPLLAGTTMGKMHKLARAYRKKKGPLHLGSWDGAPWINTPETVFHPSQADLFPAIKALRETVAAFPITPENYGLIHDDFHTGNIFYMENRIAVLDFGCLHQSWFAKDVCSALIFRVWIAPEKENLKEQVGVFLKGFLEGYRTEAEFPREWLKMFPALLKLRELSLYQSFYKNTDISGGQGDALCRYLHDSILNNTPFLDMDFETNT